MLHLQPSQPRQPHSMSWNPRCFSWSPSECSWLFLVCTFNVKLGKHYSMSWSLGCLSRSPFSTIIHHHHGNKPTESNLPISDEKLRTMGIVELNLFLQKTGFGFETNLAIKKRRRTLKNREYSATAKNKRKTKTQQLIESLEKIEGIGSF